MTILDAQTRLSNAQLITTAGTILATNNYDALVAGRNLGRGEPLRLSITIDTTMTGGTSIQPQYIESVNSDMSSPAVLASGPTTVTANALAGTVLWDVHLPQNTKRYVGVQYVVVGTFAAGAVSANIVHDTNYNPYYASNTGLG